MSNETMIISEDLKAKSTEIKKGILELAAYAGEGHCAPALSIADIMTAIYFSALKYKPEEPDWVDRDRFILSKGHACQALYVTLHHAGYFDDAKLKTFLKENTGLAGHPVHGGAPGIEASTGSLGQGFSLSVGIALGARIDNKQFRSFSLIGDGECNEGIIWEAAMAAAHYKLDNLVVVLDRNNFQCDGDSSNVLRTEPMDEKWKSFGWGVKTCNGHDTAEIAGLLGQTPFEPGKPSIIIANTIKGKGVSFMENDAAWHYRAPNQDELADAVSQLDCSC